MPHFEPFDDDRIRRAEPVDRGVFALGDICVGATTPVEMLCGSDHSILPAHCRKRSNPVAPENRTPRLIEPSNRKNAPKAHHIRNYHNAVLNAHRSMITPWGVDAGMTVLRRLGLILLSSPPSRSANFRLSSARWLPAVNHRWEANPS